MKRQKELNSMCERTKQHLQIKPKGCTSYCTKMMKLPYLSKKKTTHLKLTSNAEIHKKA